MSATICSQISQNITYFPLVLSPCGFHSCSFRFLSLTIFWTINLLFKWECSRWTGRTEITSSAISCSLLSFSRTSWELSLPWSPIISSAWFGCKQMQEKHQRSYKFRMWQLSTEISPLRPMRATVTTSENPLLTHFRFSRVLLSPYSTNQVKYRPSGINNHLFYSIFQIGEPVRKPAVPVSLVWTACPTRTWNTWIATRQFMLTVSNHDIRSLLPFFSPSVSTFKNCTFLLVINLKYWKTFFRRHKNAEMHCVRESQSFNTQQWVA